MAAVSSLTARKRGELSATSTKITAVMSTFVTVTDSCLFVMLKLKQPVPLTFSAGEYVIMFPPTPVVPFALSLEPCEIIILNKVGGWNKLTFTHDVMR